MSADETGTAGLLRWYPPAWRERYGEELVALMEDHLGGGHAPMQFKLSVVFAGLRERCHDSGLVGERASSDERARAGSILVLCAWAAFVLAGISYSKLSEHFARAVPVGSRALPQGAFNVVAVLGILGGVAVLLGAAAALPAFVRFVRDRGWHVIGGHVLRATVLTALVGGTFIPLSLWAHHLTEFQRNGGDRIYSGGIGIWAVLVAAALAQWTVAGVAAARRIDLPPRILRFEAALAVGVAGAMLAITAAVALWWASMASDAPGFLQGKAIDGHPSPFNPQLVMTLAAMLAAVLVGGYGVFRIAQSTRGNSAHSAST